MDSVAPRGTASYNFRDDESRPCHAARSRFRCLISIRNEPFRFSEATFHGHSAARKHKTEVTSTRAKEEWVQRPLDQKQLANLLRGRELQPPDQKQPAYLCQE
jgi:hypothetical protein